MRDSWPLPADLTALLTSASIEGIAPSLDLQGPLLAAVERLEGVGYRPFLAGPDATERAFDPPGPVQKPYATLMGGGQLLSLKGGAVEIESVSLDTGGGPVLLTPRLQWNPAPGSAPGQGEPYTMIRFSRPVFALPGGLTVTARWGYAAQIPEQAWYAVLYEAALNVLPLISSSMVQLAFNKAAAASGGQIKAKESGPQRIEYQTVDVVKAAAMEVTFAQWFRDRDRAFARYRLEDL